MTTRLIAQDGILGGQTELYLQGEAATGKVPLPAPLKGRNFHLFCSTFNAGAAEFAAELQRAPIYVVKGKRASAPLEFTTDVVALEQGLCDHMLVLLDERTWTSGEDTAKFVEHIHTAMKIGVHINCVHEFPSVVGPPRHECEFGRMFDDEWTPAHLTGGKTNLCAMGPRIRMARTAAHVLSPLLHKHLPLSVHSLAPHSRHSLLAHRYKEIAFALKGAEWRKPALVAVASKLVTSAGEHKPIEVKVPSSYEQKIGTNPWLAPMPASPLAEDPETLPLGGLPSSSVPFLLVPAVESSSSHKTPPNPPATDALKA